MNDVVIRCCDDGSYLVAVYLCRSRTVSSLIFVSKSEKALMFENEKKAQATIDFISNVFDFEKAECLEIVVVP